MRFPSRLSHSQPGGGAPRGGWENGRSRQAGQDTEVGRMNWQGKKVLVTGAGGFIGSHLTEALVQHGARVRALVHYNGAGSAGWLDSSSLRDDIDIFSGVIC